MNWSRLSASSRSSDCCASARRWRCSAASASIWPCSRFISSSRRCSDSISPSASSACWRAASSRLRRRSSRLRCTRACTSVDSVLPSSASTNITSPARTAWPSCTCRSSTRPGTGGTRRITPRSGTSTPPMRALRVYSPKNRKASTSTSMHSTPTVSSDSDSGRTSCTWPSQFWRWASATSGRNSELIVSVSLQDGRRRPSLPSQQDRHSGTLGVHGRRQHRRWHRRSESKKADRKNRPADITAGP